MTTGARVLMRDLRELGYCARGARAWCARHGFAFRDLLGTGLPAAAVAATGDAFGIAAAEHATKREGGSGG